MPNTDISTFDCMTVSNRKIPIGNCISHRFSCGSFRGPAATAMKGGFRLRVLPGANRSAGGNRARGRQSRTIKNPVDSVDSVDAFAARVDAHCLDVW